MNDFKRIVIQNHERRLYRDVVDPDDLVTYLQSKHILQIQDREAILNSSNKTAKLIHILLQKTEGEWFEEFIKALSTDFDWIANSIKAQFSTEHDQKRTYYLAGRGNVPPLPQHNVTRTDYVLQLREKIKNLKRDSYLVVHGMSGSGKTCLVTDALQDISLLEECLDGYVYWLSVGDLRNDEPDDLQCRQLQKKLCDMAHLPVNPQQDLLVQLRRHFSIKPNYSCLLVLDKVRSSKVVDALNIGCKILVTTQDCDVVKNNKPKFLFPVNPEFSENESVQLLKDFVLDGYGDLQPRIKESAMKIHRVWKGHPMIIGLIGGELSEIKEESQKSISRWREYERTSQSGETDSRRRSIVEQQMSSIIDLTTDKLQLRQKNLFAMLAVLVEDTNITTDVLQILWGLNKHEVQDVIDHFYRRSLVFRKFNHNLQKPVYGIHDIIHEHLKKNITDAELQNMHQDLVSKYQKACNGDFANLPQDNYIYSYLCHHIECANKWNEFRHQFFSLKYIESKLKATGPGDLLLDLHKYQTGLTGNGKEYLYKIGAIKKLVNDSGWDIHQNDIDAVQCALLQPQESFLHQQGANIASQSGPSKIYFSPTHKWERPKDLEFGVADVSAVSIVTNNSVHHADGRVLIYPDKEGHIVEVDMHYRQRRRSFKETSEVILLKMSPLCDKFLSALSNGSINIWSLTSDGSSNADTPPPSMRQRSYLSHFTETRTMPSMSFQHSRQVTSASFSSDGKLIVSTAQDGTVCVWNLEENKQLLSLTVNPNPHPTSCSFVCGDNIIVYGGSNFLLFFRDMRTKEEISVELEKTFGTLVNLLGVPEKIRELIVVQEKAVLHLYWEDEKLKHQREGKRELDFVGLGLSLLYKHVTKITSAVYCQHHHLLLGTNNGCLFFFDIFDVQKCPPLKLGSGDIKALDMVGSRIVFAQNDLVKMCWPEAEKKLEIQPLSSHLGWTARDVSVYTTATSNGDIKVFHDGKICAEAFRPSVSIVRVSTHGNHVLIGTSQGGVLLFDTISKNVDCLQSDFTSPITYLGVAMYRRTPMYLAAAEENGTYTLQAIMYDNQFRKCQGISAPVVKTFICSNHHCLITVLSDYTILAWDLDRKSELLYPVQEGRTSAKVTDASLSSNEDVLVLSDQENCFHIIKLTWPRENINSLTESFRHPKLALSLPDIQPTIEVFDEVDGVRMSVVPNAKLKVSLSTRSLQNPSWCCCVCSKGVLAAIGYDDCKVMVWNLKKKSPLHYFSVLPNRRTKVCQLQFSPYDVNYNSNQYNLILFVVTDCMSLWDMSYLLTDNAKSPNKDPICLACVSAGGNPILELSISPSFSKFSASDVTGSYFLWNVWDKERKKTPSSVFSQNGVSSGPDLM